MMLNVFKLYTNATYTAFIYRATVNRDMYIDPCLLKRGIDNAVIDFSKNVGTIIYQNACLESSAGQLVLYPLARTSEMRLHGV